MSVEDSTLTPPIPISEFAGFCIQTRDQINGAVDRIANDSKTIEYKRSTLAKDVGLAVGSDGGVIERETFCHLLEAGQVVIDPRKTGVTHYAQQIERFRTTYKFTENRWDKYFNPN